MSETRNNNNYGLSQFQRNRYFYGKLMTVRDFETEQGYNNDKRCLINRTLNRPGIICGFDQGAMQLAIDPDSKKLIITFDSGGLAIDCSGREIVVPIESQKDVLIRSDDAADPVNFIPNEQVLGIYYVYLEYAPRNTELVGSAEDPTGTGDCVYNRVIEDFQVIASATAPTKPTIGLPVLPAPSDPPDPEEDISAEAKKIIKGWLKDETAALCNVCGDTGVFIHAFQNTIDSSSNASSVIWNDEETVAYLSFIHNGTLQSELLASHVADFENPHKITAEQSGALVSIDGVGNPGGDVDLESGNTITIVPDDTNKKITIGESHSNLENRNPHQTTHEELVDVLEVDPALDDDERNKHVSNQDAKRWDEGAGIGSAGGMATGAIEIKTDGFSALTGSATETHGLLGRLTETLDTGSDYRSAGVAGVSEIEGRHGVYARAPGNTHALYVQGSAHITGSANAYHVNTYINAGGVTLNPGDVVSLTGNPVSVFRGDENKVPVAEVTLAEADNAERLAGIVDRKAVPEGANPGDLTAIEDEEELYAVTHGCYARCKADTSGGEIEVGDLLTPSAVNKGCAQKATDPKIGTIIGKALEPLSGTDEVQIIAVSVNLQ